MDFQNFLIELIRADGNRRLLATLFESCSERGIRGLLAELSVTARRSPDSLPKSSDEIVSITKSAAVLEDALGGVGSPTAIHVLLPLAKEQHDIALDWVLRHTTAYSYYSSAKSAEEYLGRIKLDRATKLERARKESERQENDRQVRANRATERLEAAIRRGDKQAVVALLNRGADRKHRVESGLLPAEFARELGHIEIAQLIDQVKD